MKVAIYCRVSTDNQETEGTSLQTQLEACLDYCQEKGYEVCQRFSEAYSGPSLERPDLDKLRELVRNEQIDIVVVYSLDRLSRDPVHGVILTQELEKHQVVLEALADTVDTSETGKLINYIKGYAAKLDAERRKDATMRGKKAKARQGYITCGGSARLYGYDYIKAAQEGGSRRVINELEAKWVRQIYQWLAYDGMSTSAITYRLRALNVPTKLNRLWCRAAVLNILKNPAYMGKTYAFTSIKGRPFSRNQDDWVEIPDATPAIIEPELFEAAQKQLRLNKVGASRNMKRHYLLRGHIRCRQCSRAYYGCVSNDRLKGDRQLTRRYRCSGKLRMLEPINRCNNHNWRADKLEAVVWTELQNYLSNRELILAEIEKQRQDADQLGIFKIELQQVERQFKAIDREQHQLLRWALKDFPADQVETENRRLNKAKETLEAQRAELRTQLKVSQDAAINIPKLEDFIQHVQGRISSLDYEGKHQALDMLGITVWLDSENVDITGSIPLDEPCIVNKYS